MKEIHIIQRKPPYYMYFFDERLFCIHIIALKSLNYMYRRQKSRRFLHIIDLFFAYYMYHTVSGHIATKSLAANKQILIFGVTPLTVKTNMLYLTPGIRLQNDGWISVL